MDVRHLFLFIALFSAPWRLANAADSPAQLVVGEGSIEERLLLPRKLEPGNGEPIEVYAALMVIVDTRLDEPLILAVPNNGADRARYGICRSTNWASSGTTR